MTDTNRHASEDVTVYMIVMEAVYDHGTGGIFSTREAAEAHASALEADSDGHHDFRIEERVLDLPEFPEPRWTYDKRKRRTARIEFVPHVGRAD